MLKLLNENKLLFLLASLVLLMLFGPFFDRGFFGDAMLNLFFTLIMIAGLYAVSQDKGHLIGGALLGTPTLIASWIVLFLQEPFLSGAIFLAWIVFDVIVAHDILKHIMEHPEVTKSTIYGAVSVYLLIGIIFGASYIFLERVQPGSFYAAPQINPDGYFSQSELFYFSFVSLATLGYGDIAPLSQFARSLAALEAIAGALFIAVLIGTLIGSYVGKKNGKKAPEKN